MGARLTRWGASGWIDKPGIAEPLWGFPPPPPPEPDLRPWSPPTSTWPYWPLPPLATPPLGPGYPPPKASRQDTPNWWLLLPGTPHAGRTLPRPAWKPLLPGPLHKGCFPRRGPPGSRPAHGFLTRFQSVVGFAHSFTRLLIPRLVLAASKEWTLCPADKPRNVSTTMLSPGTHPAWGGYPEMQPAKEIPNSGAAWKHGGRPPSRLTAECLPPPPHLTA